jgi:hypothetical protein
MTIWEYKVVHLPSTSHLMTEKESIGRLEYELNDLGQNGYELVLTTTNISDGSTRDTLFFLKKERIQ